MSEGENGQQVDVSRLGVKGSLSWGGVALMFLSLLGFITAFSITPIVLGGVQYMLSYHPEDFGSMVPAIIGLPCWYALSVLFWVVGRRTLQKSLHPDTSLTRHHTGGLPEDETLVRASEEPPAHQADVLLRAAQGGQETREEQLLRPLGNRD